MARKLGLLQYERLGIRRGGFDTNFNFEALTARPLRSMISEWDMKQIHDICLDPRLNNQLKKKEEWYESILNPRGLVRMGRGTNRVIFKNLEDQSIVVKIPLSEAGKFDGPAEMKNQWLIKPFCTKIFEVSPDGLITVAERGELIRSQDIFYSFGDQLFDFYQMFLGKYVMADVGTEFRKNWVVRAGFGAILCDFPLIYPLDGSKLYCDEKDLITGIPCGGEIDYDMGYNRLYCKKCGKQYFASALAKQLEAGLIKRRRCSNMKIRINTIEDGKVVSTETEKVFSSKTFLDDTTNRNIKAEKTSSTGRLKIRINDIEENKEKDKKVATTKSENDLVQRNETSSEQVQFKPKESKVQEASKEPEVNINTEKENTEITTVVDVQDVPVTHRFGLTCDDILKIVNDLYDGDAQKYVDIETNAIANQQDELNKMFVEIEEMKAKYLEVANKYNEGREENLKRAEALEEFATLAMNHHLEEAAKAEEMEAQQEVEQNQENSYEEESGQEEVDAYSAYLEEQCERLISTYGFARETVAEVLDNTGFNIEEAEKILKAKKENMEKSRNNVDKIRNRGTAPFKNTYADSINQSSEGKYPAKSSKKNKNQQKESYAGF